MALETFTPELAYVTKGNIAHPANTDAALDAAENKAVTDLKALLPIPGGTASNTVIAAGALKGDNRGTRTSAR